MSETELYNNFSILNKSLLESSTDVQIKFLSKISYDINHMKDDKKLVSLVHDDLKKILLLPSTNIELIDNYEIINQKWTNLQTRYNIEKKEINTKILKLEEEKALLISEKNTENARLTGEKLGLAAENARLTGEKEEFAAEKEELAAEKEELVTENEELAAENARLTGEKVELDAKNARLAAGLDSTRAEILRLSTANPEIIRLSEEVRSLTDIKNRLEPQVISLSDENVKLNTKINTLSITSDKNKWKGINTDMVFYSTNIRGGESDNIWPMVNIKWEANKPSLGIQAINNENIKFKFINQDKRNQTDPILGNGTYTAVYKMKNDFDLTDTKDYILRIYERIDSDKLFHLLNQIKIEREHQLFSEYFIEFYYYGQLKTNEFEFSKVKTGNKTTGYRKKTTYSDYSFDYIITKVYNIPSIKYNSITLIPKVNYLTNSQKYKFLIKNLIFLDKLQSKKRFHADYKIENIAWEGEEMDVKMIDYDIDTIQKADSTNKYIQSHSYYRRFILSFNFSSTYIPEYIKAKMLNISLGTFLYSRFDISIDKLDKFSIGGLDQIIKALDINLIPDNPPINPRYPNDIALPGELNIVANRHIERISQSTISKDLNLYVDRSKWSVARYNTSIEYDNIPTYAEIKDLFEWLFRNNRIAL